MVNINDDTFPGGQKGFCCCATGSITAWFLLGFSFQIVGPLEAGLAHSTLSLEYDYTKVYGPGRYMLGPDKSIKTFPLTWQTLMFCNDCPHKDRGPIHAPASGAGGALLLTGEVDRGGSPVYVDLEVFLYYKLKRTRLPALQDLFGANPYHDQYVSQAKKKIMQVIQTKSLVELLTRRESVAQIIGQEVNEALNAKHAYVVACYLGTMSLDRTSDEGFQNQTVAQRQQLTKNVTGQVLKIRATTQQAVAGESLLKNVLLSDQYKRGNTTIAQFTAAGEELLLRAQGIAFRDLQLRLNFTQAQLLKYIYYERIRTSGADIVAGFSGANKLVAAG